MKRRDKHETWTEKKRNASYITHILPHCQSYKNNKWMRRKNSVWHVSEELKRKWNEETRKAVAKWSISKMCINFISSEIRKTFLPAILCADKEGGTITGVNWGWAEWESVRQTHVSAMKGRKTKCHEYVCCVVHRKKQGQDKASAFALTSLKDNFSLKLVDPRNSLTHVDKQINF